MTGLVEIGLCNAVMAGVLAVLAACLCRLYRRPAFAHALWLVVLVKLLTPPLVPVPLPWFGEAASPAHAGIVLQGLMIDNELGEFEDVPALAELVPAVAHMDGPDADQDSGTGKGILPSAWLGPVLALWLSGSLVWSAWIALCTWRFHRLLRFAVEADPDIQDQATDLAVKLGLARAPRVWLLPGAVSPMLWTPIARPRLLFPARLVQRLEPAQLKTLLVHELAHWRRRDHWVRFLELAVQIVYWWHPAVWWARSELHEAEEQCCDAWVLRTLEGADQTYALALLETVAFISHTRLRLPATASGIGHVSHLRRRLTMILGGNTSKSLTWAGALAVAGFGLALLPLVPARAQESGRRVIGVQIVPVEDKKGPVDQQIEAVKRLLQLLEEQKRSQTKPATRAANPEEINKAKDAVKKLAAVVAAKREDLQQAERALQEAKLRLEKLSGKSATLRLRLANDQPGLKWKLEGMNIEGNIPMTLPIQPEKLLRGVIKLDNITLTPEKPIRSVAPARSGSADLNQRLERLLREVEELRREIKGARPK